MLSFACTNQPCPPCLLGQALSQIQTPSYTLENSKFWLAESKFMHFGIAIAVLTLRWSYSSSRCIPSQITFCFLEKLSWISHGLGGHRPHLVFRGKLMSFISGTTLLEVSFFSTPTCSRHRANFKGQCKEWWCLCTSSFSYDTVHSIHSSRIQGLLSMPGIIFISKAHKKQVPSSWSCIDEGKKSKQWQILMGIFSLLQKGKGPTTPRTMRCTYIMTGLLILLQYETICKI